MAEKRIGGCLVGSHEMAYDLSLQDGGSMKVAFEDQVHQGVDAVEAVGLIVRVKEG